MKNLKGGYVIFDCHLLYNDDGTAKTVTEELLSEINALVKSGKPILFKNDFLDETIDARLYRIVDIVPLIHKVVSSEEYYYVQYVFSGKTIGFHYNVTRNTLEIQ